jgi:hypothetical protein
MNLHLNGIDFLESELCLVDRTPSVEFSDRKSSPKRNRLGQCLLSSKESKKTLVFVAVL